MDWEDAFPDPMMSSCERVSCAFGSFFGDLTFCGEQMVPGRWLNFVEANRQTILHYWLSGEHVLSMEEVDDLHRKLTDRM